MKKIFTYIVLTMLLAVMVSTIVNGAAVRKSIRQWLAELPLAGRMYTSTTTFVEDDAIQLAEKSTLPTSGYNENALIVVSNVVYLSTATVTTASCWVALN